MFRLQRLLEDGERVDGDFVFGVFISRLQPRLEERQHALVDRLRLGVFSLPIQNAGQRRQISRDVWVIRPERPLADFNGAARSRFAHRETPARVFQAAEVVIERGDFRVFFAQMPDGEGERAAVELPGCVKPPGVFVEHRVVVQHRRQRQRILRDIRRKDSFGQRQRLLEQRFGLTVLALRAEPVGALAQSVYPLFLRSRSCVLSGAHAFPVRCCLG